MRWWVASNLDAHGLLYRRRAENFYQGSSVGLTDWNRCAIFTFRSGDLAEVNLVLCKIEWRKRRRSEHRSA